jgi:Disulphide bond corrector protein DsbC
MYMKRGLMGLVLLFLAAASHAQIKNPVTWTYVAKKTADKTYELHMTASIEGNWHLYAQDAGEGPEPTSFNFTKNPLLNFEGKVKEVGKMQKTYDKNFRSVLKYYGNKVVFVQKVKVKSPVQTVVKGTVTYMVCNDRQCLPPKDVPFSINVGGK